MTETCTLHCFVECDIDMRLAEELRLTPSSLWLMGPLAPRLALGHPATETQVSAFGNGSETDVLASFRTAAGGRHRLWIENKIDATRCGASSSATSSAPGQTRRKATATAGRCCCSRPGSGPLGRCRPASSGWISRPRPGRCSSGTFEPLRTRYPRELFLAPRSPGMAPCLLVDFKARKGEVDLTFKGVPFDRLTDTLRWIGEHPGRPIRNPGSAALRIDGLSHLDCRARPAGAGNTVEIDLDYCNLTGHPRGGGEHSAPTFR